MVLLSLALLTLSWKCAGCGLYHCYLKGKNDRVGICLWRVMVSSTEEVKKKKKTKHLAEKQPTSKLYLTFQGY